MTLGWLDDDPSLPGHPDPYPLYRALREAAPACFHAPSNTWLVSGHAEAQVVLAEHRVSRAAHIDALCRAHPDNTLFASQARELVFLDPPHHEHLKRFLMEGFDADACARLQPAIEAITDELVTNALEAGQMDAIKDLGEALPTRVIATILGVPREDVPLLREAIDGMMVGRGLNSAPSDLMRAQAGIDFFRQYFSDLIGQRRARPTDDLLTRCVQASIEGCPLDRDQLLAIIPSLFVGGHVTIRNAVGTSLLALLRHPAQWARLREAPVCVETAVDELLRYESPIQATLPVVATDTFALGDGQVLGGQEVVVLIGAVNRDPRVFAEPDRLDVLRHPNHHLAFGKATHFCLGALLARMELVTVLRALSTRVSRMELSGEPPQWRHEPRFRGLVRLDVRVTAG